MYYISIITIILSCVSYQLLQKKIPATINPAVSLIITYGVALAGSFLIFLIYPLKKGLAASFGEANITSYLLGLSIIGIELGYLLIYRSGGKVSLAYTFVSAVIIVLLTLSGVLLFHEHMNLVKISGLLLCMVGMILLTIP